MDYRSQILFCDNPAKIDLDQLLALLRQTAFWAQERNRDDLAIAIANSNPVISVWDGGKLIGFARATSDCVYRAAIWDVVIHPEYRGAGLGSKLVETVLSNPRLNRVERVYLTTTYQAKFYERIGFQKNSSTTMVLHNTSDYSTSPILESQVAPEEENTAVV